MSLRGPELSERCNKAGVYLGKAFQLFLSFSPVLSGNRVKNGRLSSCSQHLSGPSELSFPARRRLPGSMRGSKLSLPCSNMTMLVLYTAGMYTGRLCTPRTYPGRHIARYIHPPSYSPWVYSIPLWVYSIPPCQ